MLNTHLKEIIRSRFNKAACTYDHHCSIQNEICKRTIDMLLKHKTYFTSIADFACGTGESTKQVTNAIDYKQCVAIDFAQNLLAIAKSKLTEHNIHCMHGDLDEPIATLKQLDLIFCNMGLQWADDIFISINYFKQYLQPDGYLLFSVPIDGNFPEIKAPFKLQVPSHYTILEYLNNAGFSQVDYQTQLLSQTFLHPLDVLKSLKYVGTNSTRSPKKSKTSLRPLELGEIFIEKENTCLTYKVGMYLARKCD